MMKVALFGAGRMGALHAANLMASPRLELGWIIDPDRDRAARLAARTGATVAEADEVLGDSTVRGVVIASSTDSHLGDVLAAFATGKAVFCEKPLSLSTAALLESEAALTGPGRPPLFVGFNRRFDPGISGLQAALGAGEVGRLESLHIVSHDPSAPSLDFVPRSGGLFRDFTIHDFDTAAWLVGDEIEEVFAAASCLVDPAIAELGDVDSAKLVLRSRGGVLCAISNSRRSGYGYDQRIEAFGSRGSLSLENVQTMSLERWGASGACRAPIHFAFPDRYADAYRRELDHFADILAGAAEPRTGYAESLAANRLADAAERSVRTGQPVTLNQGAPTDA